MDNQQARFFLKSFRPSGADSSDPDFIAALELAMVDPELGEWLASERAFDSEFANALESIAVPENLRHAIMTSLAIKRADFPVPEGEMDSAFIHAIASIQPPDGLRESILVAMQQTERFPAATTMIPISSKSSHFKKFSIPFAAAAGIAFAFILIRPANTRDAAVNIASSATLPLSVVKASFVKTYETPDFDLEVMSSDQTELAQNLQTRNLPRCEKLPPGLAGAKSVGCRELVIHGKRGSLICFLTTTHGVVHMIVFRQDEVSGESQKAAAPVFVEEGDWKSASWHQDDEICLLMASGPQEPLSTLF